MWSENVFVILKLNAQNLANHTPLVLIGLQAVAKICLKKMKVMQEKYNNGMKFWLCVLIIKWL
ncbi:hypothetical protein DKE39_008710 [Acinetobacter baumannii]|nr:hypothetical protein DKE39_008710 [Acinetobacter baumannii]